MNKNEPVKSSKKYYHTWYVYIAVLQTYGIWLSFRLIYPNIFGFDSIHFRGAVLGR